MAFTIAISGCSSAGKSTLAFLLAEIFADGSKPVPIIHGDAFFMPKHLCPLVTYTSAPNDTAFCQLTLNDDRIGEYVLSWDGTRANNPFMQYTPPTTNNVPSYAGSINSESTSADENNRAEAHERVPSSESVKTTFSAASRLHEGGRTKVFTISGPDTDCIEAINFVRMFQALKNIAKHNVEDVTNGLSTMDLNEDTESDSEEGGAPLFRQISEQSDGGVALFPNKEEIEDLAPAFPHITIDIPALHAKYSELITQMRAKVQEFLANTSGKINNSQTIMLPQIQIIEAFQLFSEPSAINAEDGNANTSHLLHDLHTNLQKLSSLSTALTEAGDVNPSFEASRSTIESKIQTINSTCKRGMSTLFSAKLWLSTSPSLAKTRRFSRPIYIDHAAGGLREPGQMWKTEGYFDQIAWKNHVESHKWLIGENGSLETGELGIVRDGVHVRAQDVGVEDTVRWAVGAVLEEMGKALGIAAKDEGKKCGGCEGCAEKSGEW